MRSCRPSNGQRSTSISTSASVPVSNSVAPGAGRLAWLWSRSAPRLLVAALLISGCGASDDVQPGGASTASQDKALAVKQVALTAAYTLTLGSYSATNTASDTTNVTTLDAGWIPQGTPFTVTTCDSYSGDTFLRLVNGTGAEVASNDDSNGTLCSTINFTAPGTDHFWVRAGCFSLSSCSATLTGGSSQTLEQRWAPILFQSDNADSVRRHDYITKFNYDNDYNGANNWNHLTFSPPAFMYYAISETLTHYFVTYYFYYPQDTNTTLGVGGHENDFEGAMLVVAKGGLYGTLMDVMTEWHGNYSNYPVYGGVTAGTNGNLGQNMVWFSAEGLPYQTANHIQLFSEARGHGIHVCGDPTVDCVSAPGVVYTFKGGISQTPDNVSCADGGATYNINSACGYGLISMSESGGGIAPGSNGYVNQGLWYLQNHMCPTCTFSSYGVMPNTHTSSGNAEAPWAWDSANDGHAFRGDFLCDPAAMVDIHLNGSGFDGGFSHTYVNHPYYTHSIQIDRIWNNGPTPTNLWVLVYPESTPSPYMWRILDYNAYRTFSGYSGPANDGWHNFRYGGDAAVATGAAGRYGDADWRKHYFCRPSRSATENIHIQLRKGDPNASTVLADQVYNPGNDNNGRIDFSQASGYFWYMPYPNNGLQFIYTRDPQGGAYP